MHGLAQMAALPPQADAVFSAYERQLFGPEATESTIRV